jgi:divalent metal cation (Fe/Co/Zn/Cd) transporter
MLGFIFGMFMSGHISAPADQMFGIARIEPVSTTFIGCFIALGFGCLYIYIAEWSKLVGAKKEKPREKGVE